MTTLLYRYKDKPYQYIAYHDILTYRDLLTWLTIKLLYIMVKLNNVMLLKERVVHLFPLKHDIDHCTLYCAIYCCIMICYRICEKVPFSHTEFDPFFEL